MVQIFAVWSSEHEARRVPDGSHFTAFTPLYRVSKVIADKLTLPMRSPEFEHRRDVLR